MGPTGNVRAVTQATRSSTGLAAADAFGRLPPLVLPPDLRPARPASGAPGAGTDLGQHYARCYGCGDEQSGGLHLRFRVGEGVSVTAGFVVTDAHQGSAGLAHGGVLSAALDETQATLMWLLRTPAVTARLETDFLVAVPIGSTVRLEATCLGVANRKIYTAAKAWLVGPAPGDPVLALRSAALFVTVPVRHFTAHADADVVEASFDRAVPDADRLQVSP
jgi:acyl-coenzyme A thioesterase PaaI-like protein